jgi:hypothetical protein
MFVALGHTAIAFTLGAYTADVPAPDHTAAEQITGLFPRQAPHPAPPTRGSRRWTAL